MERVAFSKVTIRKDWNVREDLGDIETLAHSMERGGLFHPLVVNQNYELLAGHRRYKAAELLGWDEIDVTVVKDLSNDLERLIHLDENLERKDLTIPKREQALSEKSALYKRLVQAGIKEVGDFRRETEQQTGLSKTAIYRGVQRHDNASDKVWDYYTREKISSIQLDELIKLPANKQDTVLLEILGKSATETKFLISEALASVRVPAEFAIRHPKLGTIHVDKFLRVLFNEVEKMLDCIDCFEDHDVQSMLDADGWRTVLNHLKDLKMELANF